jgi:subtilase family serine protease
MSHVCFLSPSSLSLPAFRLIVRSFDTVHHLIPATRSLSSTSKLITGSAPAVMSDPASPNSCVHGSARPPMEGFSVCATPPLPTDQVKLSIVLRSKNAKQLHQCAEQAHTIKGEYLSQSDFDRLFGASPQDLAAVRAFANSHHLTVVSEDSASRIVKVSGSVQQVEEAFGVDVVNYESMAGEGKHRGYVGEVQVPANLVDVVESVLGLDNRPIAEPHVHVHKIS